MVTAWTAQRGARLEIAAFARPAHRGRMNSIRFAPTFLALVFFLVSPGRVQSAPAAAEGDAVASLQRELAALTRRVAALEETNARLRQQLETDRLVVRRELIVSDTGAPWEAGFAVQQIPRGVYARSLFDGPGGLWVRSRLIKGELDDPFDDRFHALERDGRARGTPGHISWNVWTGGAWRQLAILQGEMLEPKEMPWRDYGGGSHPGRLRFQSFRPGHDEPLTDALLGQGRMSIGGGGFGGGGLPDPAEILELWGGDLRAHRLSRPAAPAVVAHDRSGERRYAIVAVGAQGSESEPSAVTLAAGRARLEWDSVTGADAYVVMRDGRRVTAPIRREGSRKAWVDPDMNVRSDQN